MSKLGFDRSIRGLRASKSRMLHRMMREAQREFRDNFNTESRPPSKFDNKTDPGGNWESVERGDVPPILDVTGELKANSVAAGNVVYSENKAVLTIDPIDARGRGYAEFQQDGFIHSSGMHVPARPYISESDELQMKQHNIMMDEISKLI